MAVMRQTGGPCDTLKQTHEQRESELIQAEVDRQAAAVALTEAEQAYATSVTTRDNAAQAAANAYNDWIVCITSQG